MISSLFPIAAAGGLLLFYAIVVKAVENWPLKLKKPPKSRAKQQQMSLECRRQEDPACFMLREAVRKSLMMECNALITAGKIRLLESEARKEQNIAEKRGVLSTGVDTKNLRQVVIFDNDKRSVI